MTNDTERTTREAADSGDPEAMYALGVRYGSFRGGQPLAAPSRNPAILHRDRDRDRRRGHIYHIPPERPDDTR